MRTRRQAKNEVATANLWLFIEAMSTSVPSLSQDRQQEATSSAQETDTSAAFTACNNSRLLPSTPSQLQAAACMDKDGDLSPLGAASVLTSMSASDMDSDSDTEALPPILEEDFPSLPAFPSPSTAPGHTCCNDAASEKGSPVNSRPGKRKRTPLHLPDYDYSMTDGDGARSARTKRRRRAAARKARLGSADSACA